MFTNLVVVASLLLSQGQCFSKLNFPSTEPPDFYTANDTTTRVKNEIGRGVKVEALNNKILSDAVNDISNDKENMSNVKYDTKHDVSMKITQQKDLSVIEVSNNSSQELHLELGPDNPRSGSTALEKNEEKPENMLPPIIINITGNETSDEILEIVNETITNWTLNEMEKFSVATTAASDGLQKIFIFIGFFVIIATLT